MVRRFALLLTLLAALLAACGGDAAPTTQPTTVAELPPTAAAATGIPTAPAATAAPTAAATDTPAASPTPAPLTTDSRTGRPALARGALTARPIVAMIDNHPDAYPQTGLDEAAVVFEALAEYGVTRYMALYAPELVPVQGEIGPVRSARIYFVQWAMGFRAIYTHAGGSPAGLERLAADNNNLVIDIDLVYLEDRGIFSYSRRERGRLAPHNLYTSQAGVELFGQERAAESLATDVSQVGFLYAADDPGLGAANPASSIGYYFLYSDDPVGWFYEPGTNEYFRTRRNRPHIDAVSGEQLSFKSVAVMEVNEAPIPGDPKGRIDQDVIGEGAAVVFANGGQTAATWRKESEEGPLRFFDESGAEIVFPAGPLWIAAIPSLGNLTIN
ncbi:MAG TPA: DUF3048 domain-containing protein [Herpetosiphonaceae bacterium]|nr:DUF3048 domain-containing protein [Herpetosiphonaceae bacterium]